MGKHGSIKYQISQRFNSLNRIGESKHNAKKVEKDRCASTGEKWNPVRVPGVHSKETMKQYLDKCQKFGQYCKEKFELKKINEIKPEMIKSYLEHLRLDRKYAATSLTPVASAITKMTGITREQFTKEIGYQLPGRSSQNITRSRGTSTGDKHFSAERNADLVQFGVATGLRKDKELAKLRPEQISADGSKLLNILGKGNKLRDVNVLKQHWVHVKNMRDQAIAENRDRVFPKIHGSMDQHANRREYAQQLYQQIWTEKNLGNRDDRIAYYTERGTSWKIENDEIRVRDSRGQWKPETWQCKSGEKFNRVVALEVSHNLGHNREEVAITNYLK